MGYGRGEHENTETPLEILQKRPARDEIFGRRLTISWIILFAAALVDLMLGLATLLFEQSSVLLARELGITGFTGLTPEQLQTLSPNLFAWIGFVFKSWSAFIIGASILTMGIAASAYRRGERWSWFVLALGHIPTCLIYFSIGLWLRSDFILFIGLVVLAYLVGLFLPAREFLRGEPQ